MPIKIIQLMRPTAVVGSEAISSLQTAQSLIIGHGCDANSFFEVTLGGDMTGDVVGEYSFASMAEYETWRAELFGDDEFQRALNASGHHFDLIGARRLLLSELDLAQ